MCISLNNKNTEYRIIFFVNLKDSPQISHFFIRFTADRNFKQYIQ